MRYLVVFTFIYLVFCVIHWKWFRAGVQQIIAPGYGTCYKCGRPWKFVKERTVMFNYHEGTFATCVECWKSSTLPELKKYYTECYRMQLSQGMDDDHYKALMDSVESNYLNQ